MWRFVISYSWQLILLALIAGLASCQEQGLISATLAKQSTSQITLDELWVIFGLKLPDRIVILSLGPLLLTFQIFIIAMFLKYTSLLAKPGNVFFVLILIETILNIHLISTAIYHSFYESPQVPTNYVSICSGMGYVQALFETNHLSYLYIYLFYVVFIIRYTLKKKTKTFWVAVHIIIFLVCLGITNYMYFEKFIGLNFTGICGITSLLKLTYSVDWNILAPIFGIIFTFFFFGFGIFAYQYYKKHMPGGQLKNRKNQYSKIILMFVVGFFICQLYPNICCIALAIQFNQGKPIEVLHPMVTFANFVRLSQYYFTIFLIIWNNQFRQKLKFTFKRFFVYCFKDKKYEPPLGQEENALRKKLQLSEILVNQKLLRIKDNANQIDLLFVSQIYTIVSGMYAILFEYFKFNLEEEVIEEQKPINFKESITFQIDKQSMKNYEFQTRMMFKLQILHCRLIFYFPKVFLNFLVADGLHNVYESFTILQNAQKILSTAADGQGGKSGEFFFFTADRKFVLKTITQEEFNFLKNHMVNFYEHYKQNPDSMLAKIYGLMTFKGDQIQRTYHLILMKNIMGCPREQVQRVYDLKGSTYDREVTTAKIQSRFLPQITLKDIDFIKYEGRLQIDDRDSHILRMIIKKDAEFLKNMNLIDYSFLVVRVKWTQVPENPKFWNEFQRIVHHEKPQQYYHLGIIDYLQLWDLQKKGQSFWKKLTGKKDISAVNPSSYCSRFLNFIDQISINFQSSARAEGAKSNMLEIMERVRQAVLKQQQQSEKQSVRNDD